MKFLDCMHPAAHVEHLDGFTDLLELIFGRSFVDRFVWPEPDALMVRTQGDQVAMLNGCLLRSLDAGPHMAIGHILTPGDSAFISCAVYQLDVMAVIREATLHTGVALLSGAFESCGEVHWLADVRPEHGLIVVTCVSCVGRCETVTIEPGSERVLDRLVEDFTARPEDASRIVRRCWDVLALAHQLQGSATVGAIEVFAEEDAL